MKRLALLLALAAPALAQVEPDSTLERVVVTATRTAAALEDVGPSPSRSSERPRSRPMERCDWVTSWMRCPAWR